jgi:hypothetical protein
MTPSLSNHPLTNRTGVSPKGRWVFCVVTRSGRAERSDSSVFRRVQELVGHDEPLADDAVRQRPVPVPVEGVENWSPSVVGRRTVSLATTGRPTAVELTSVLQATVPSATDSATRPGSSSVFEV